MHVHTHACVCTRGHTPRQPENRSSPYSRGLFSALAGSGAETQLHAMLYAAGLLH